MSGCNNWTNCPWVDGKIETDVHWLLESTRGLIGVNKESGTIVCLDPYRGRQDGPTIFLNSITPCKPSICNDDLYFCNKDGNIIKLNLRINTFQVLENKLNKVSLHQ